MPEKQHKEMPLNGKLVTADAASIGSNYRTLKNFRYLDSHLRAVRGMTKINTTALSTYLKFRNAYHFKKAQPAESHVLAQAYNSGLTASVVMENTTAIPSAGDFSATSVFADSSGAGRGYFSDASDGQIIYCNSIDSCIWGGNEIKTGAFITSTAVIADSGGATSPKDYTDVINNSKTDADNVAIIGGGNDTYTVLLLHGDGADASTTITDSSVGGGGAPPKTVTASGDAQIDTSQAKFGTGSIVFDGTGDFVYIDSTDADINDFYMANDPATVDVWVRPSSIAADLPIFSQYVDADNYVEMWWKQSDSTLHVKIRESASNYLDFSASWSPSVDTWYHISLNHKGWGGNAAAGAVTVNGNLLGLAYLVASGGVGWPDLNADFEIGRCQAGSTRYFSGWMDEFRVSKGLCRWKSAFTPPATPYRAVSRSWLVGSIRPLKGLKYFIQNGNGDASTMTMTVWNGTTWQSVAITDNTDTGAALAATGTVTFSSTVTIAKPRYLEGYFLYWYQFSIDAGEAEIYKVTLDAPFQSIVDMWDGVFRDVSRFLPKFSGTYYDHTLKVLVEDYDAAAASTYSSVAGLVAGDPLEIGFTEKMSGLKFTMAYPNSTASTVASVAYWDGSAYVSVGAISDGTSEGAISLAKNGVISWNNNSLSNETKKSVSNSPQLYYYAVTFDQNLAAGTYIDYIGGVTAQKTMSHFKFPVFAQGRVLLCSDMSGDKNKAVVSSKFMPQTYNGSDSVDIYFGEDGELTCGTELFSQFGSSLYSLILMFKDYETWITAGTDINQWENNTFLLSSSIGCPAPLTLKTINLAAEPGAGTNRSLAIWQGANGIYMSDGRAPIPIHGDIKEYFDPVDSRCILASLVGESVAFIDPVNHEYHLLIASGSSATGLNTELVYDIRRNRWFEIDRTADLVCGVLVHDTDGNAYTYGFLDTGYMERLEYGTTFDGTTITHTLQFGDFALDGLAFETKIEHLKLITVAQSAGAVTATHYGNASTGSGTAHSLTTVSTGYRIALPYYDDKLSGYPFHSIKLVDSIADHEPLAMVITYHRTTQD